MSKDAIKTIIENSKVLIIDYQSGVVYEDVNGVIIPKKLEQQKTPDFFSTTYEETIKRLNELEDE